MARGKRMTPIDELKNGLDERGANGLIPRRDRSVYLDDCGETFLGDDWKQHSYCEICWQEYCAKRDAGCLTAARSKPGEIYGIPEHRACDQS